MFRRQFVGIAADNSGTLFDSLDAAQAAVLTGAVASVGGRLADGLVSADIDADDPLVGDAVAEALVSWCVKHGLPYLLRESGRAGGRHVVAVVTHRDVPVREWNKLCRKLARKWKVVVDDRTGKVLRLPSAPHRLGLSAPILSCTITPADVMDAVRFQRKARAARSRLQRQRAQRAGAAPGIGDPSRSAREFGEAAAMARRGYSGAEALAALQALGGKVSERSDRWFRRYIWLPVVTLVAAERGVGEEAAWEMAQSECAAECRRQGVLWWRGLWEWAKAEAALDRPRRYRLDSEASDPSLGADPVALAAFRIGLRTAAAAVLADIDPRRLHSVQAALYALAPALVARQGSMSMRDLSVRALIDLKTVSKALATAVDSGLLVVVRPYAGGATDCHQYGLGPAAVAYVSAAQSTSSNTSCSTPAPTGSASRSRLTEQYRSDRQTWRPRCDLLAVLAPGERLATSQHPAAKLLRSTWFQRRWWRDLPSEQQAARRAARRETMLALRSDDRRDWLNWLEHRELITNAIDAITDHTPASGAAETVLQAPLTMYRGMRDPRWRIGGTPSATSSQLELSAA
ncbi:hypothetical protein ACH498_25045 [Rhodococcus erythropolis]